MLQVTAGRTRVLAGVVVGVLGTWLLSPEHARAIDARAKDGRAKDGQGEAGTATVAPLSTILARVTAPGARAVLVNVWATWCEPCREEMPDLLRFYREHRAAGLRLVMISADDEERRDEVSRALAAASQAVGLDASRDLISFIKGEDDTAFVNGLDRRWSGALPATFLYDARGDRTHSWLGPVTYQDLDSRIAGLLTPASGESKTKTKSSSSSKDKLKPSPKAAAGKKAEAAATTATPTDIKAPRR
jgi:thiol-disulfide isomerase/thioredoxin